MKLVGLASAVAALLLMDMVAQAGAPPLTPQVGDTYEITLTRDSVQQGSLGSSGSSHDKDTITERVTGLRADGLELEYDLPKADTADERARDWQFPVRVFKSLRGPAQLLNEPELQARVDAWLKAAELPRTACGHWIFTWNAFRIECDPQSVIKTVEAFDLRPVDLREGAPYQEADARGPGILARKAAGAESVIFIVEMPVDPDAVRRARAESDVVVGEIMKKAGDPGRSTSRAKEGDHFRDDLGHVRNRFRWKRAPQNKANKAGNQRPRRPVRDTDRYRDAGAAPRFTTRLSGLERLVAN